MSRGWNGAVLVREVELSQPLAGLQFYEAGRVYRSALALVTLHRQPLGIVELRRPLAGYLTPAEVAGAIDARLHDAIRAHLATDGCTVQPELGADGIHVESPACVATRQAFLAAAPLVSVVVCTRDRPQFIPGCLAALGGLDYPNFEVVLVDNAPTTPATERVVRDYAGPLRVRYTREPRPGASWARNRGIAEAAGDIVVFADDDVQPCSSWLTELARALLLDDRTMEVTGLILPRELDTPEQVWFEHFAGLGKGFEPLAYDLDENRPADPLFPYLMGRCGSGGNVAFRRSVFERLGNFDVALGTGGPAMGGEDIEITLRALHAGCRVRYAPGAYVFHTHPDDWRGVSKRAFSYGAGLTACLTSAVLRQPSHLPAIANRLPRAIRRAVSTRSYGQAAVAGSYPREFKVRQLLGMAAGPLAYARSRRVQRLTAASAPHDL